MRRILIVLGAVFVALAVAGRAQAQRYGSIVLDRYVVCRDDAERTAPPRLPASSDSMELIPVPRRRAPATLVIAPLLVIDVAVEQPIPSRRASPARPLPLEAPPEEVVTIEGENDYHCIGLPRGKARILRVVGAGPGARFGGGRDPHGYRWDNLLAAGMFDLREAIPALRRELDRPIPAALDHHAVHERLDEKRSAIFSLADMGDVVSTERILSFLRELETKQVSGFWAEALEPLARLDPEAAQRYATEVVQRASQHGDRADFLVRTVLPFFTRPSPDARAALQKLDAGTDGNPSRWHHSCSILAARLRVGDEALAQALRPDLAGDLTTNRATVCYDEVIGPAFPGEAPDEVDTLLKRRRYDEVLRLIERARALEGEGKLDRAMVVARQKLLEWLQKHRQDSDVASARITNGIPETNAKHLAAMAALGDAGALRDLYRVIDDPDNVGTGPWIAAALALRFGFDGAADHAANRLRLALEQRTERWSRDAWPRRGQLVITEHGVLVEALAKRKDPRFSLGLLDRDAYARSVATNVLAREKTERACEIVGGAAKHAEGAAVQQAFWAMSVLGEACRDTMWRLLGDRAQPRDVRGMALEALAMMRDRRVSGLVEPQGHGDENAAARGRARIIFRAWP